MNIIYHRIKFLGYKELDNQFKYAHLTQVVECATSQADEQDLLLFGFENQRQERVLLYQVPINHTDFEVILEKYPSARIIRSIGYEPILSSTEELLISKGLLDISPILSRQLVRYQSTLFLDKAGMPIYCQNKLSLTGEFSDQDYRINLSDTDLPDGKPDPILAFAGTKY